MEKFLSFLKSIIGFVQDIANIVASLLAALHAANDVLQPNIDPDHLAA